MCMCVCVCVCVCRLGTVIVFGALYYQGFSKKDKHSSHKGDEERVRE